MGFKLQVEHGILYWELTFIPETCTLIQFYPSKTKSNPGLNHYSFVCVSSLQYTVVFVSKLTTQMFGSLWFPTTVGSLRSFSLPSKEGILEVPLVQKQLCLLELRSWHSLIYRRFSRWKPLKSMSFHYRSFDYVIKIPVCQPLIFEFRLNYFYSSFKVTGEY